MRRTHLLRPGLVLTASSLACGGPASGGGTTPEEPEKTSEVAWKHPTEPVAEWQDQNPRDGEGRLIFASKGRCWVELPFETPPTSVVPPPTKAVECPEPMLTDPAWAACAGGQIKVMKPDPLSCTCYVFGNPPPAPVDVDCPAETKARAGK